jgi:aldehyde:ferredoxin oxidoreductase
MGHGKRADDSIPYRSQGPVTVEEYISRQDRYDTELREVVGFAPEGRTVEEKNNALRKFRESQYEKLIDAVYKRRGWTSNGVPTIEKLKELDMDLPELVNVVKNNL